MYLSSGLLMCIYFINIFKLVNECTTGPKCEQNVVHCSQAPATNITLNRGLEADEKMTFGLPKIVEFSLKETTEIPKLRGMYIDRLSRLILNLIYQLIKNDEYFPLSQSKYTGLTDDEYFKLQWYLNDCRPEKSKAMLRDINVVPVWYKHKIFGKGVKVIITDLDAIQPDHKDLKDNYDARYSKRIGKPETNEVPRPPRSPFWLQKGYHATACGGIVGMKAGNEKCGVGIAPLVTLGSVQMYYSKLSDQPKIESLALAFKSEEIDIMNNSWGPTDNGKVHDAVHDLLPAAIKSGVTNGRRKKGVLYVHAAGNGKSEDDNCAYDTLVNSVNTITVASVAHDGTPTFYSERCSAIMVTTYGGNQKGLWKHNLITTGVSDTCIGFIGTSAAAPVVSGVLALVLEANPDLCYRAVHHLFPWTCEIAPLYKTPGWKRNAAGIYYNQEYGFGLINALKMVEMAISWKAKEFTLPPLATCVVPIKIRDAAFAFHRLKSLQITASVNGCRDMPSEINYLEHVRVSVEVEYPERGAIEMNIKSPSGTLSTLLESRELDTSKNGLDIVVDSVHFWGESPRGVWTITVFDTIGEDDYQGEVTRLVLILSGTKRMPHHYKTPRSYYKLP